MYIFAPGWYLLYTMPRQEEKVARQLAQQDLRYFLPTIRTLRQWSDRKKIIEGPLFPSYIFVYLDNVRNYLSCQDLSGVVSYVRFGNVPAVVPERVVNNIRLVVTECSDIEVLQDHFKEGQQLLIQHGPLTGLSCEMVSFQGRNKALVRVALLQRNLLINVSAEHLTHEPGASPSLSPTR